MTATFALKECDAAVAVGTDDGDVDDDDDDAEDEEEEDDDEYNPCPKRLGDADRLLGRCVSDRAGAANGDDEASTTDPSASAGADTRATPMVTRMPVNVSSEVM